MSLAKKHRSQLAELNKSAYNVSQNEKQSRIETEQLNKEIQQIKVI